MDRAKRMTPPRLRDWLTALQGRGSDAAPPVSARPAPSVRGFVEGLEGLVICGWAWVPGPLVQGQPPERFELVCNGIGLACAVTRAERADVRAAVGGERLQLGFEIEIPGLIWHLADEQGQCALGVRVDGVALAGPAITIDRAALVTAVASLRQTMPGGALPLAEAQDLQYRILLLLEHIAAADLWPALAPAEAIFVQTQGRRFGLPAEFLTGTPTTVPLPLPLPVLGAAHDLTELSLWRLLREFNAGLSAGPAEAPRLLDELMSRDTVRGEARDRFLLAVLPYFAGIDAYQQLRPWLPMVRLRGLALAGTAWELSLVLPEQVVSGDYAAAAATLDKLALSPPGWLNTECLGCAARSLARQWLADPKADEPATLLVRRLLELYAALGKDYWSRLHDARLIDAMVSLISLQPILPSDLGWLLARDAVRHYGLVPSFWETLQARMPEPASWPPELRDAEPVLPRLRAALDSGRPLTPAAVWPLLPALAQLRAMGNTDVDQVERDMLLAMLPALGAAEPADALAARASLMALSPTDLLRLAAHPLAEEDWFSSMPDLSGRIRRVSGVPHAPLRGSRARLIAALRPLARDSGPLPALSTQDFRLLAGPADRASGVCLAAAWWVMSHREAAPELRRSQLTELRELWTAAHRRALADKVILPAALTGAWHRLGLAQRAQPDPDLAALLDELGQILSPTTLQDCWIPPAHGLALRSTDALSSTLVVVYSCRRNLDSRVRYIRDTWAVDLDALGVPWIVVVGDGQGELVDHVLSLPVSDAYEQLPQKTLALIDWVYHQTDFGHLLKIDDDCHLAADAYFAQSSHLLHHYLGRRLHRAEGGTNRLWHQSKSSSPLGHQAIDKSPEPSIYGDGGAGYSLSRMAMGRLKAALATNAGARLTRSAYMEDKMLGDLLALGGIELSSEDHETLVRRCFGADPVRVNAHQNLFYPGPHSPTVISHLDDAAELPAVQAGMSRAVLRPARLWPTTGAPQLGGVAGTNQLELLSPSDGVRALAEAPVIVVAVARNEMLLMPHFLAHYRAFGVRHFVLVDNLSDDGTRQYLLAQPDVVLYSADTEYRHSHYGVAWQQAVLGAHALGKWVVLADIDEFLVYPGSEDTPLVDWLAGVQARGFDAVLTLMVDMYPEGELDSADFGGTPPFEAAPFFDREPLLPWRLGSGCYSNGPTYLSALRHRLIPRSAPNLYTSQKLAVFRYQPWVRLSEGLHYAAGLNPAPEPAHFAHFKYHAGFRAKVMHEVARQQHFNGAAEYRKYLALVSEAGSLLFDGDRSVRWAGSRELAVHAQSGLP